MARPRIGSSATDGRLGAYLDTLHSPYEDAVVNVYARDTIFTATITTKVSAGQKGAVGPKEDREAKEVLHSTAATQPVRNDSVSKPGSKAATEGWRVQFYSCRLNMGFPGATLPPGTAKTQSVESWPCQDRHRFVHPSLRFIFSLSAILYRFLRRILFPNPGLGPPTPPPGPLCDWIARDHNERHPASVIEFLSLFGLTVEDLFEMCDNGLEHALIRDVIGMFERELNKNTSAFTDSPNDRPYQFLIESRPAPRETDLSPEVRGVGDHTVLVYLPVVVPSSHIQVFLRPTPGPGGHNDEDIFDICAGIEVDTRLYLVLSPMAGSNVTAYRVSTAGIKYKYERSKVASRLHEANFPVLFYVKRRTKFMTAGYGASGLGAARVGEPKAYF
jgi:hypothetical protein